MKAKVQNCLNNFTGVFVCWVTQKTRGITLTIDEKFQNNIKRIIYVMRRHHYFKDFNYPTCFKSTMIKHDEEYAELMAYFVGMYNTELKQAGYIPERGDGVGFCGDSMGRPFLMYGIGKLDYKRKTK